MNIRNVTNEPFLNEQIFKYSFVLMSQSYHDSYVVLIGNCKCMLSISFMTRDKVSD